MQPHPEIAAELAALGSQLAGFPRRMPFAVPVGYFDSAADRLVGGIGAADAEDPRLIGLPVTAPFTVPDGYFETFPESVLEAALEASLPQRAAEWRVPDGYFAAFPDKVLAAAKAADAPVQVIAPARAKSGGGRRIALPALRWAAAALLILGIGLGLYRAGNPATVPVTTQRALAALPERAVQAYVVQNLDEFDTDMITEAGATAPDAPLQEADIQDYLADDEAALL